MAAVSERRFESNEFELSNLGFLPLLHSKHGDCAIFMGAQSCQKPQKYFDPAANAMAELATKFNLLLCASRFAHYLKVLAREKLNSFKEIKDREQWLNQWMMNYIPNEEARRYNREREFPLRDARVEVRAAKGKQGCYEMVIWLKFQIDIDIVLPYHCRLVAEIPKLRE